ncbi:MAG: type I pantothenate kinase [Firmicutes bacterium]|uniref:Pantothenate kinase n=1 Tax=Candidatus Gallilactobacillus intestinavium TaxID=2840838 RepID=A0A9D9E4R1_9LACO|nr:type I pantothenate kinase [Candidatus Gallilactobacillus intestinavium]
MKNFNMFTRQKWSSLYETQKVPVSEVQLNKIKSVNDKISLIDVKDIYIPLVNLIYLKYELYKDTIKKQNSFLNINAPITPFIIGIAGSVSVGKSTISRLLNILFNHLFSNIKVQQITTDGFLYSTKYLKEHNLLNKKGFPESYNMPKLINFLEMVKQNKNNIKVPKYSHEYYDILPNQFNNINNPDILIVEGINVLQISKDTDVFTSDFFDLSIYVDADKKNIKKWFINRFELLLDSSFQNPQNYYYDLAIGPRQKALNYANDVWKNINLPNLDQYILPTKNRANIIIHKDHDHLVDKLYIRNY